MVTMASSEVGLESTEHKLQVAKEALQSGFEYIQRGDEFDAAWQFGIASVLVTIAKEEVDDDN